MEWLDSKAATLRLEAERELRRAFRGERAASRSRVGELRQEFLP